MLRYDKRYSVVVRCPTCDWQQEFTRAREFRMCFCGESGFDLGDPPYYARWIGKAELVSSKEAFNEIFTRPEERVSIKKDEYDRLKAIEEDFLNLKVKLKQFMDL